MKNPLPIPAPVVSVLARLQAALLTRNGFPVLYGAAIAVLAVVMLTTGFRITATTNLTIEPFDQNAYVFMSRQMEGAWYPWYTDGTRNPLFPWMAAVMLDASSPEFFLAGKRLNVILATLATVLLAAFFRRQLSLLAAFNASAIAGLGALLPISTFFGAEPVFYLLFFFLCVCGIRLLNENPLRLYAFLGLLAALAYLAKPSTTPFLLVFLGLSAVRTGLSWLPHPLPWPLAAPQWSARRFFAGMVLFALIFGGLIAPRLVHSHRTWGSPFYNLPQFWFWADTWEDCVAKYTDCRKVTLAKMPPEDQPSAAGYFRRHNLPDAVERVTAGAGVRLRQLFLPEQKWRWSLEKSGRPKRFVLPYRGIFLAAFGLLAVVMVAAAARCGRLERLGPVGLPLLFASGLFVLYLAALGWYEPIGPGHRFIMTLYIPLLWMAGRGADQARAAADSPVANLVFLGAQLAMTSVLVWRMAILAGGASFEKILGAF